MLRAALYARFSSENQREESILAETVLNTAKSTITLLLQSMPMKQNQALRLSAVNSINSC